MKFEIVERRILLKVVNDKDIDYPFALECTLVRCLIKLAKAATEDFLIYIRPEM